MNHECVREEGDNVIIFTSTFSSTSLVLVIALAMVFGHFAKRPTDSQSLQ